MSRDAWCVTDTPEYLAAVQVAAVMEGRAKIELETTAVVPD